MNGQYVYTQYTALKSHFNTKSYDYVQYSGNLKNVTRETYDARPDKLIFERFAKTHNSSDMPGLFVSHFIKDPKFWIGDYENRIYLDWKGRINGQDYIFQRDINKLFMNVVTKEDFKRLFIHPSRQHPLILQMMLNEEISIESFTILDVIFPFFNILDKNIDIPIVWEKKKFICKKYVTFLNIDTDKYKVIFTEKLNELL